MTPVAITAEGSAMRVVARVTGKANGGGLYFIGCRFAVTALALQARMCACQRKFGFTVVVETPERPPVRVMTALTLRSEFTRVPCIFVTRRAYLRRLTMS